MSGNKAEMWYTSVTITLVTLIVLLWIVLFVKLLTGQADGNLVVSTMLATAFLLSMSLIAKGLFSRQTRKRQRAVKN